MSDHMNGHHGYPTHPIRISREIVIPSTGERYFCRYTQRIPDVVPYRSYVQNNRPVYTNQEPPLPPTPTEDLYNPIIAAELLPEYRVNANPYGPRPDAVWAPNPDDMFSFSDMRNALPQPQTLPETFSGHQGVILPIRSRRSSPVDGLGPLTVGGPVIVPGQAPNPEPYQAPTVAVTVTGNGPVPSPNPVGRLVLGTDLCARERAPQPLPNLSQDGYTGIDDQELEEGLQALERRIVTEFRNAD